MKRTQSEYFKRYNICYSDVDFVKLAALTRETPVLNTEHLVEMIVKEKMREGGYQVNPFLQYMKCMDGDPWVGDDRFLRQAAANFMWYVGLLGKDDADDSEWDFEASGFKGGMFSRIRFIGPLEPVNDWLRITEERVGGAARQQLYRIYRLTFRVLEDTNMKDVDGDTGGNTACDNESNTENDSKSIENTTGI